MEWTTERRYRRYEDWTQEERKEIQEKMAQPPMDMSAITLNQRKDSLTTRTVFLTLMASGLSFTKTSPLVQLMD